MGSPRVWRHGLSELRQLGRQGRSKPGGTDGVCPLWFSLGAGRSPGALQAGEEAVGPGLAEALAAVVGVGGAGGDLGSPGRPDSPARVPGSPTLQTGWARHVTIR